MLTLQEKQKRTARLQKILSRYLPEKEAAEAIGRLPPQVLKRASRQFAHSAELFITRFGEFYGQGARVPAASLISEIIAKEWFSENYNTRLRELALLSSTLHETRIAPCAFFAGPLLKLVCACETSEEFMMGIQKIHAYLALGLPDPSGFCERLLVPVVSQHLPPAEADQAL
jgi:hypothetical protein